MGKVLLTTARWFGILGGVVLLTSVTVDATLNNGTFSQSALGILALRAVESSCPQGTAHTTDGTREWCMDIYEVTPGSACPHTDITGTTQTTENMETSSCAAESKRDGRPWVFVSYHQAQEICAKRGMRLPNHQEWYMAAVGTPDSMERDGCNLNTNGLQRTGASPTCVSPRGMYDMIGNAWEWVDADVTDGMYAGRKLPETGYVSDADGAGVALATTEEEYGQFHRDYFWSLSEGSYGMIRGGYFGKWYRRRTL
jgi:formylglycine-generating enzyme required for sulfatase activity